jgi:predicted XRE-type DNA-binding protein
MPKSKPYDNKKDEPSPEVGSDNIFTDLGFPDDEAVNLLARADLAIEIRKIIKANGWSQREAAKEMGVAQPRIAEIVSMKLDHYSVDLLLKYLDKLGRRVSFVVRLKNDVA